MFNLFGDTYKGEVREDAEGQKWIVLYTVRGPLDFDAGSVDPQNHRLYAICASAKDDLPCDVKLVRLKLTEQEQALANKRDDKLKDIIEAKDDL